MSTHIKHSGELDTWEQALEDAPSISLWLDPYDVQSFAKAARENGTTYIHIPVSRLILGRIHKKAEAQNKTTTTYLREVVEQI